MWNLIYQGSTFIRPRHSWYTRWRHEGLETLSLPSISLCVNGRGVGASFPNRGTSYVHSLDVSVGSTDSVVWTCHSYDQWTIRHLLFARLLFKNQDTPSHRTRLAFCGSTSPWKSSPSIGGNCCGLTTGPLCQEQSCKAQGNSSPTSNSFTLETE